MFEDWYRANGKNVGPSRSRIVKWLKDPRTDAAEYKAYGNSVAVPVSYTHLPPAAAARFSAATHSSLCAAEIATR